MKSLKLLIDKSILISTITLAGLFVCRSYAYAQVDTTVVAQDESIEYLPLQEFDFGVPNPNADRSKLKQQIDYQKTVSVEELHRPEIEAKVLNSGYKAMALSEDGSEYAVGQIPYQESVTPYGGRVYNVPIMVSPMSKFPPQISLQYNSQAGNGLAGYGWDIGGLSSITITNKNLYYHGKVAPADINDADAVYALDGVPLVQNDDATLAGEYPLETAKGNIIVKKHMSGNVITYFTALYPDGSKATYGITTSNVARVSYPITLWEDRFGNRIEYNYYSVNSDYRISSIKFKHTNNSSYIGELSFTYSSRTDFHIRYRANQATYQNCILKSIKSVSNGSVLSTYTLTHELRDGVNLLTSIGCTNAAGENLPPLTFEYGKFYKDEDSSSKDFSKIDEMYLSTYFSSSSDVKFYYVRGKYMPDSYRDGLMIFPAFQNYGIIATQTKGIWPFKKEYHKFGSKYAASQEVLIAPRLSYMSNVDNGITVGEGFQCIDAVDIDGDGVDEIVKVNFNGISESSGTTILKITIYAYNASSGTILQEKTFNVPVNGIVRDGDFVSPMCRRYYFGDFKGGGKAQLLTISYNQDLLGNAMTSYASLIDLDSNCEISETNFMSLGLDDYMFCIDLDGDGRTEVCHATPSGLKVYNFNGSSFSLTKTHSGVTSSTLSEADYYLLDINGDGYVDIARKPVINSSDWCFYKFTGETFDKQTISLHGVTELDRFMFFDVNKDGLPDLIKRRLNKAAVYLNEKGTYKYDHFINSKCSFAESTEFVPCNVRGYNSMSDFITVEGCYVNLYKFSQDLSSSRLLTRITNSLGATSVNNYENMAYSDCVYNIDKTRTYSSADGYAKCRFPLPLLYNTQSYISSSLSGAGQVSDLWYSYSDACVHTRGLGFCGFGKVRTTDFLSVSVANKEPVTIETRDPEKMGVTTRLVHGHRMTQDNPYDITDYTYDTNTTTYGKLNPRLTKIIHTDTLSTSKSTTSYVYDSYGYPTSIREMRTLDGVVFWGESKKVEYLHKTAANNYCLGNILSDMRTKIYSPSLRPGITATSEERAAIEKSAFPGTEQDDANQVMKAPRPPHPNVPSYWIEKQVYSYNGKMLPLTRIDSVGTSSSRLNQKLKTCWTYDNFGNVTAEKYVKYDAATGLGKTYTYDGNGINMLASTNELGQTTTFSNFNKYGQPLSRVDYKGRTTSFEYDNWGQLISTTAPDGIVSSTSSEWGGIGCYTVTKTAVGKPSEIVHYDAAGREVRSGSQRFDGKWIFTDKVYGQNGQIRKVSLPFKSTASAALWNTYEYDEYQRPVRYTQASGSITTWAYKGKATTESKDGVWNTKIIDANGRVAVSQDAGGAIIYTLRPDGQPSSISMAGTKTSFSYDAYGRRVKIVDPSAGTQTDSTAFNSDGSTVTTHTNPNGSIITYTDRFGRTTRVERPGEYNTDYLYNPDGLLASEVSSNGTSKAYTYDEYDRISTVTETVPDGKWLRKAVSYSADGNISSIAYESQNGPIATEDFSYSNGTNVGISLDGTQIRLITEENEFGQPTSVSTGGIERTYSYNAFGQPAGRTMGDVMDFSYSFDPLRGNLMSRTDNLRNLTETFGYDELNRLTAIDDREITYSKTGNITSIDAVGDMAYDDSTKPYQLTSLTLEEDVVPARVQNITYTCYSRPSIITEGGRSAAFTYNGDGDRVKMNVSDGATGVLSRYYVGNQYECDVTPGGTTERLYLGGDAYSAPAVYIKEGSGAWTFYNAGRDYLGNITHIATHDGTLVEENSYDPWGRLRNPETKEIYALGTEPALLLGRGYTGHEHLRWFGLINMNARLYDPVVGRFLSPDPYVQMPDFSQSFNRYSYCLNNPLVYIDKNGKFFVFDSFIVGLFGGWNRAKQMAYNDIKIWGGLFVTDPNKNFWGRVGEFFSKFTWQSLQTLGGFLTAHAYNTFRIKGGVVNVSYKYGTTVLQTDLKGWGAVTQGNYIIGSNSIRPDASNTLFQHEYGHYIQSQKLGPAYYFAIGIPSICSASDENSNHDEYYTEQDANIRAFQYFNEHIDSFYSPSDSMWDFVNNPIKNFNPSKPLDDAGNKAALANGVINIDDWQFSITHNNGVQEAPFIDDTDIYDVTVVIIL